MHCTGNPLRKKFQINEQRKKKRNSITLSLTHSDRDRERGYLENRGKALGLFNLREMAVPAVPIPFQRRIDVVVNAIGATAKEAGVLAALIGINGLLGLSRAAPTQKKIEIGIEFLGWKI